MAKRLIICLVLIIAAATPEILFSAEKVNLPNLKFTKGHCEDFLNGITAIDSKEREGIIKTSWLNENTLLVECFATGYCGGEEFTGKFELKGDSLLLKYETKIGSEVTECICFHKINYELSNIPKQDYKITLKEEEASPGGKK